MTFLLYLFVIKLSTAEIDANGVRQTFNTGHDIYVHNWLQNYAVVKIKARG